MSSLVAQNDQLGGDVGDDCSGELDSLGHNLVQHLPAKACTGVDRRSDITGRGPRIAGLRDNGGPTKTHALARRSPAVDHGSRRANVNRDQRGVRRDRRPDIGAYERR